MIHRGTNHVIFSSLEMMQRVRKPETIQLLEMLMWYYETWSRLNMVRKQNTGHGDTSIAIDQTDEFKKLMEATRIWLQPDEPLDDSAGPPPPHDSLRKPLGKPHNPEEYGLFPPRESTRSTPRVKLARKRVPLK